MAQSSLLLKDNCFLTLYSIGIKSMNMSQLNRLDVRGVAEQPESEECDEFIQSGSERHDSSSQSVWPLLSSSS